MIPQMLGRYLLGTTPWVSHFQRQSPLYHDDELDVMVIAFDYHQNVGACYTRVHTYERNAIS